MINITSLKNTLKTLPIIGVLAMGLALAPATSMAGNGDRGHHKSGYSKSSGKHHDKGHYRSGKHAYRKHDRGHKRNLGHHLDRHYSTRYGNRHDKHYRGHSHGHHYDHRGHATTHYVVNEYPYRDHYIGLDHLRFMIGLHTDNFDITFRD